MRIGTGWVGWTEQQTLATSIPVIELAGEGVLEKLRLSNLATWGGAGGAPAPDAATEPQKPMSGEAVRAVFRTLAGPKK